MKFSLIYIQYLKYIMKPTIHLAYRSITKNKTRQVSALRCSVEGKHEGWERWIANLILFSFSWCGGQSALFRWVVCWDLLDSLFICQSYAKSNSPILCCYITHCYFLFTSNKHLEEIIRVCSHPYNESFMIMG